MRVAIVIPFRFTSSLVNMVKTWGLNGFLSMGRLLVFMLTFWILWILGINGHVNIVTIVYSQHTISETMLSQWDLAFTNWYSLHMLSHSINYNFGYLWILCR